MNANMNISEKYDIVPDKDNTLTASCFLGMSLSQASVFAQSNLILN